MPPTSAAEAQGVAKWTPPWPERERREARAPRSRVLAFLRRRTCFHGDRVWGERPPRLASPRLASGPRHMCPAWLRTLPLLQCAVRGPPAPPPLRSPPLRPEWASFSLQGHDSACFHHPLLLALLFAPLPFRRRGRARGSYRSARPPPHLAPTRAHSSAIVRSRFAARAASQDALEAYQEAQASKQMAQEKAEHASEQAAAEGLAERVGVGVGVAEEAAIQTTETTTNEPKEKAWKELHDTSIAKGAQSALASFSANQSQEVSIPSQQSGFIPYSSAVQNAPVHPQSQQGATQRGQGQPMNQSSNTTRCQDMLLQGAHLMAQSATAQLAAAQNLAAGASDPRNQHVAREQAEAAQNQMMMAHQFAAAAQAPETAVQAVTYLPNLFNKA